MAGSNLTVLERQDSRYQTWSNVEKIAFRFAFVFFILLIIPVQSEWYVRLFSAETFYNILSAISGTRLNFIHIPTESGRWGAASFASWGLATLIALLVAAIWTILSRNSKRKEYNVLYYWLGVIVRYRIALGLIAFGYIKFFPMQMPFPSISNLNTEFGDYAPFKLYWQIVGVSFRYESFLGFLEIAAGTLLFFRKTIVLGAIINAGVLFNIAHANLGYDGAVHVYASYFVLLSLFLLMQYFPNIWKLFIKRETVTPYYYRPDFSGKTKKYVHLGTKATIIVLFIVVYGYFRYDRFYNQGILKEPVVPGLSGAAGHYNISSFVLNGDTLPYSPHDSLRWHDAVFERYSTLVYKVKKDIDIAVGNGTPSVGDILKDYELTGRAGGKTYLYYEIDSATHKLYLVDKNQKFSKELRKRLDKENSIGLKELYGTSTGDSINILLWSYERPDKDRVVLSGKDVNKDSITVVLDRLDESYLTGKEWYMENNKFTYN
ncbi:hypothetical protein FXV77_15885 [Sphingobacterium phlebotomi]|uniref:DoxX family protein n=1 Tax=Sphingobacterium phlebotomi TaxID=2605433 RepID=A0A5D4H1X0_9SPHI|nr:hypothetical protein [Sphingobacterium phlebotomi]TYR34494.1 hypothetical protein FXV77_15885 [Sphingobacterium phlebotomi]